MTLRDPYPNTNLRSYSANNQSLFCGLSFSLKKLAQLSANLFSMLTFFIYNISITFCMLFVSSYFIHLLTTPQKSQETSDEQPKEMFTFIDHSPRVDDGDLKPSPKKRFMEVNADDEQIPVADKEQNVTFMDKNIGYTSGVSSQKDDIRDLTQQPDTSLQDFLSRPIALSTFNWSPGQTFPLSEFNPWKDFLNNSNVRKKIDNYKLLTGDLHLKFLINGSPFHYGRLIVYYTPLVGYDDMSALQYSTTSAANSLILNSQKPHIFLNPTTSEGGEMHLPFFWLQNALDIVGNDVEKMGKISIQQINQLKHANGGSDSISVSIFAWMTNVTLSVPTAYIHAWAPQPPRTKEVNADEYGQGPISKPATTLANMMEGLKTAPGIGKYALATQIGAKALSKVASIFGYSRTPILTSHVYRPITKSSFALTNVEDDTMKLSVDCKQELTIDPTTYGVNFGDELDVKSIAQHESYLTTFTWANGTTTGNALFYAHVQPLMYGYDNTANGKIYYFTAPAFAMLPFDYWRGSIRYRFQIVSSNYHRGRLLVAWDPVWAINNADANSRYSTIVDISQTTDFTIQIGWGQQTTFLKKDQLNEAHRWGAGEQPNTPEEQSNTSWAGPLPASARLPDMNGILRVSVLNDLAVPNTTINNDIQINVFVSVGDDFEVAAPDERDIALMALFGESDVDAPGGGSVEPQPGALMDEPIDPARPPEGGGGVIPGEFDDRGETKEVNAMESQDAPETSPDITVGALSSPTDPTLLVHFGEVVKSFRPLLKRYNINEFIDCSPSPDDANDQLSTYIRPMYPIWAGYQPKVGTSAQVGPREICNSVNGKPYIHGFTTLLNYLSSAFVAQRGSTRWHLDLSGPASENLMRAPIIVARTSAQIPNNASIATGDWDGPDLPLAYRQVYSRTPGHNGILMQSPQVNPTVSFEVPYYSFTRFAPSRWLQNLNQATTLFDYGIWNTDVCDFMPNWVLNLHLGKRVTFTGEGGRTYISNAPAFHANRFISSVAAGDDYNLVFYIGPPPMYYNPNSS